MSQPTLRPACAADAAALLGIYEYYIRETVVTFEYDVPSVDEFAGRIRRVSERFPWLVCERDGVPVGYAYASPYGERAAYGWSVELSVYVSHEHLREHIATALYTALLGILRLQGCKNAFAVISSPNPRSEAFHTAFGFEPAGLLKNAGFKHGRWCDVTILRLPLGGCDGEPAPVLAPGDIPKAEFDRILESAVSAR